MSTQPCDSMGNRLVLIQTLKPESKKVFLWKQLWNKTTSTHVFLYRNPPQPRVHFHEPSVGLYGRFAVWWWWWLPRCLCSLVAQQQNISDSHNWSKFTELSFLCVANTVAAIHRYVIKLWVGLDNNALTTKGSTMDVLCECQFLFHRMRWVGVSGAGDMVSRWKKNDWYEQYFVDSKRYFKWLFWWAAFTTCSDFIRLTI